MRAMTKIIIPLLLLLAAFSGGYYVGKSCGWRKPLTFEDREAHREKILKVMTRKLNLTEDQESQIKAILKDQGKLFEDLRAEVKPRFKEIHRAGKERINAILNEEQRARFETLSERFKSRRKN